MSYHQYGIYLIPPPHLLHPIGLAHQLLKANFNTRTAAAFMVHCTLKGFFKLADGKTPADFIPALDALFARTPAFETALTGLWDLNRGEGKASILIGMDRTRFLLDLHNAIREIVVPSIAPDCLFSPVEPAGPNFPPHITFVQGDAPVEPGLHSQIVGLCQYIYDTSLKGPFQASDLQLIEFYSEDWAGNWWETLCFRQLKGWRLA
jgi:2'-5' RNA ligase